MIDDEIKIELTPEEHAALILLSAEKLPGARTHDEVNIEDSLVILGLAERTKSGLKISVKGKLAIEKSIIIHYPAHTKGDVGSYDKVVKCMSETAANAFLCSAMNHRMFDKIPKKTARVFGQHLLDIGFFKLFGPELVAKWQAQMNKSSNFFKSMSKKHVKKQA